MYAQRGSRQDPAKAFVLLKQGDGKEGAGELRRGARGRRGEGVRGEGVRGREGGRAGGLRGINCFHT